jgi:hypothetical protein
MFTSTGQAQAVAMRWAFCDEYETPRGNFKIHYVTTGEDAVPDDDAFRSAGIPFNGKGTPDGYPLYVRYIGKLLEDCLTGFNRMGLDVPEALLIRYDIFVQDMNGSWGQPRLGGPLFFSSKLLTFNGANNRLADQIIRFIAAYNLAWIALDEHFNSQTIGPSMWFAELVATYVGYHYWEDQGQTVYDLFGTRIYRGQKFLLWPMNKTGQGTVGYSLFPRWIDRSFSKRSGLKCLLAACESWLGRTVELKDLDSGIKATLKSQNTGLADLFTRFALDYYHNDLWGGDRKSESLTKAMLPRWNRYAAAEALSEAPYKFLRVTYLSDYDYSTLVNLWESHEFGGEVRSGRRHLPRLSAEAAYMHVGHFPSTQKAKLVVRITTHEAPSPDLAVFFAEGRCDGAPPYSGSPGEPQRLSLKPGGLPMVVVDRVGQRNQPNCATVVAVNRSLDTSVRGPHVERWLLLPPEDVTFWREGENHWQVKWEEAGLKKKKAVWGEYQVWRKKVGEPNEAFTRVDRTPNEYHSWGAGRTNPDDYVFTVSVIDAFGNESHRAPVPDRDPFVGDWSGFIREKHGLYITESTDVIDTVYDQKMKEAWAKIQRMPVSTMHERRLKRDEEESLKFMQGLLGTVVDVLKQAAPVASTVVRKPGVPVAFTIRRFEGDYFLTVKSVAGMAVSDHRLADIPLEADGFLRLKMPPGSKLLSGAPLFSPRDSFIESPGDLNREFADPETGKVYEFTFSWTFGREGESEISTLLKGIFK